MSEQTTLMWRGRDVKELSREELLVAIRQLATELDGLRAAFKIHVDLTDEFRCVMRTRRSRGADVIMGCAVLVVFLVIAVFMMAKGSYM